MKPDATPDSTFPLSHLEAKRGVALCGSVLVTAVASQLVCDGFSLDATTVGHEARRCAPSPCSLPPKGGKERRGGRLDLAPVAADRDVDREGDAEVGNPFHDLLHHLSGAVGVALVGFEHELVVDLEDHLRR